MSLSIRHETMCTSYGRTVEVGRLRLPGVNEPVQRIVLDVPRSNPEYDRLWLSLSPQEARDLADRLERYAAEAETGR
ncbi:hypothetical protein EF847_17630 [Actinobacteria bacterium YIM 96077]|uniref:Uncharacterized protein n=1 Tax=Phytoactinopolyspora halophila TaxID=1981511 RepID=A0A329QQZ3_9ACTN|nr:hypothetical protein [Phytoactinopolyspora halophila]AYY14245.1 hypothetical protein EF847_17630 [Actinobacteria bacterium YIM 96077]RAW14787.1 hypothetical protein DPM12_09845 [Phytoactinopolyspora halophila]